MSMKYKKLCHYLFCEGKNEKGWVGTNRSQLLVLRTVSFIGRRCSSSKDGLKIQETMSLFHFVKGELDFDVYGYDERLDLKKKS